MTPPFSRTLLSTLLLATSGMAQAGYGDVATPAVQQQTAIHVTDSHGKAAPGQAAAPERTAAPADGWAGQQGGTRGGSLADPAAVSTVATRAALVEALTLPASTGRIVRISGIIDMSDGRPFASSADQAARGTLRLPANTTLIGLGPQAGLINASIQISDVSQVIVRNLHVRNPCDVGPVWDPKDGPTGEWNSLFDGITISGSHHVWIDHNSFTDAPVTDDLAGTENGRPKQCHDGALDIGKGSDFVTVSYNRFSLHEKNMLIGSGDRATTDDGRLSVTVSNNVFDHIAARSPRVRFGKVHTFNNYHVGDRNDPVYPHVYSIGIGKEAKIISNSNVFEIAGGRGCGAVVHNPGTSAPGAFSDSGSLLNNEALGPCEGNTPVGWHVPYAYTALPATAVKAHVLARAGAGKLDAACAASGGGLALCDIIAPAHDYFVEARIRALPGGARSGQLYLLGHDINPGHRLGAGLSVTDASPTVQAEIVSRRDGQIERLKQVKRAIRSEGRFLTVRFEHIGQALSVYLNGEKLSTELSTAVLPAPADNGDRPQSRQNKQPDRTSQPGLLDRPDKDDPARQLGILSQGKQFEVVDLRVGDATSKPMRIAPARGDQHYRAQAGDPPATLPVSAFAGDGTTAETFTAESSDPAVVTVTVHDGALIATPRAQGSASITLSSVSDPSVQTIIDANIGPAFSAPVGATTPRQRLTATASPRPHASGIQIDSLLRLKFDRPPIIGAQASVRIYRKADDRLVDVIRTGEDIAAIGHAGQDRLRVVRQTPIRIDGSVATIAPHANRLTYGTAYYVVIEANVFSGATLAGKIFRGIGKADGWTFRTRDTAPAGTRLTVDDDGPADFRTVQGALNHAMEHIGKRTSATIAIANGDYNEMLFIRGKDKLTLRGQSREGVVIHSGNNDGYNPGSGVSQGPASPSVTGGRALLLVEDADLLTLDTLTLKNTTLRSDPVSGQAETIHFADEEGRLIARHASFFSEQDTVQLKGYAWFYRTLVAGNVDFIWGANRVALFEESEIRTVGDSANRDGGGYVVQARTMLAADKGFVFLNSRLTSGAGPGPDARMPPAGAAYLARSPGTATTWDNVSFINCRMGPHIAAAGWAGKGVRRQPAPNPAVPSADSGWREFGSMDLDGKPLDLSARSSGYLMTAQEAASRFGTRAAIFAGHSGNWRPQP